ncbi:MAG: hypothetical protein GF315_04050 [candidate division Zixibacteria bacterium]|nr:hypothetical protein [candidate division Zixibacteria bacterium]
MSYTERAHKKYESRWTKMLSHPFIRDMRSGEIAVETFNFWVMQDYIFVREAIRFFGVLLAKFPRKYQQPFEQSIAGLEHELTIFEKYAKGQGINLSEVIPTPICRAYNDFLLSSAYNEDIDNNFTILYTAEKAYHEAWKSVRQYLKPGTPYEEFIENWAGDAFKQYVEWLENELNQLTADLPEHRLQKIDKTFLTTVQYEYLFWEMAYNKLQWM